MLEALVKVIAIIPATENTGSGQRRSRSDIQIAMSGKSIEVLNTDCRKAISWRTELLMRRLPGRPTHRGCGDADPAIVVALAGGHCSGVFGTNQAFTDKLLASAKAAGEKCSRCRWT